MASQVAAELPDGASLTAVDLGPQTYYARGYRILGRDVDTGTNAGIDVEVDIGMDKDIDTGRYYRDMAISICQSGSSIDTDCMCILVNGHTYPVGCHTYGAGGCWFWNC